MPKSGSDGWIEVRGLKTNLQDIDVKLPKGKFVVISGVSGSGKSSLAFDTLYAEGQRRYVESLFLCKAIYWTDEKLTAIVSKDYRRRFQ